jgi:hypothetical protein
VYAANFIGGLLSWLRTSVYKQRFATVMFLIFHLYVQTNLLLFLGFELWVYCFSILSL